MGAWGRFLLSRIGGPMPLVPERYHYNAFYISIAALTQFRMSKKRIFMRLSVAKVVELFDRKGTGNMAPITAELSTPVFLDAACAL